MRLSATFLPALLGAASAASEPASVYILQGSESPSSNPPTLTPEQARLVLAQRLSISQYHGLGDVSDSTLSYINRFSGQQIESLFGAVPPQELAAELVLVVEGVSKTHLKTWESLKPAFTISDPPSPPANKKLVSDLNTQAGEKENCALEDAINPYEIKCWNGKSKVIHFDLAGKGSQMEALIAARERLIRWANWGDMNTVIVLMPESSRSTKKVSSKPYGSYEVPSQVRLNARQVEEIMSESAAVASSPPKPHLFQSSNSSNSSGPIIGVPPVCHSSNDTCTTATNFCSGRGACFQKSATCFTCGCRAQNETFAYGNNGEKRGYRLSYYGGAACQKKDVSTSFWLIATSSIVMMGLVGWAIGMLFSIGEEKLPGVIGAGVSSNRGPK
ncbi:putative endoplasmic reticulum membrane protein [Lachnellula subtilissima]|uniref:Putative endoplasmic reticulum membrane protein n=1 Tax=Lachnellula subtilissima TaxID=602034 RepID=A0A8H8U431_9HELO|nr:putative endoplasmic reticulum membrane protein [Lachnellula subtilissima]